MLKNTSKDLDLVGKSVDSDLPLNSLLWHELDPCCQRELESDRKKEEINSRLRSVDRSYSRLDAKSNIFTSSSQPSLGASLLSTAGKTCLCCTTTSAGDSISSFHSEPSDYPLLGHLRNVQMERSASHVFSFDIAGSMSVTQSQSGGGNSTGDDGSDSDDFGDFDLDDLTPFEMARLAAANEAAQKYESAVMRGFACHIDMNIDYLSALITANVIPLVVHIYQQESVMDAMLDLELEKLALRYLGTMFRRCCFSVSSQQFIDAWSHKSSRNRQGLLVGSLDSDRSRRPCGHLLVFQGKDLKVYTSDLYQFGDGEVLFPNSVLEFLDNSHSLQEQPVAITRSQLALRSRSYLHFGSDEDDRDQQDHRLSNDRFCDDPDCMKRFPHEHIAGRGGATFAGKLDNDSGIEALARNTFYKV